MSKDMMLEIMVHSFKKANVDSAVAAGADESSAKSQVEDMDEVIKKCMGKVLEDILKNFPDIQNSVG